MTIRFCYKDLLGRTAYYGIYQILIQPGKIEPMIYSYDFKLFL